ncbi:MAG: glycosyltransferase family 1 protein, partial [Chloroflexi bacterium]|nr:glycosyltransferase family 1 protein [Chloroflexota bacterium]
MTEVSRPIRAHVCFSSIDWSYLWQGPQEVTSRLARSGSRVVFIENTGVRRPRFTDSRRVLARFRNWRAAPSGSERAGVEGLTILSPLVLPFQWSPIARAINRWLFADGLPRRMERAGLHRPVLWTFLPNQLVLDSFRAFRGTRSLAIYYCVADFEPVTDDPQALRQAEDELLHEVDIVFAGGRVLEARLAGRHPRVLRAPFSVGDVFYGPPTAVPADLAAIPGPRVGYVGGLHAHVDLAFLEELVDRMPLVSFVFIGPQVSAPWPIATRPNVHVLGRREPVDLPAYIDGMDVCLVPYLRSVYTETVWPTKLHEYLARGKATVS